MPGSAQGAAQAIPVFLAVLHDEPPAGIWQLRVDMPEAGAWTWRQLMVIDDMAGGPGAAQG